MNSSTDPHHPYLSQGLSAQQNDYAAMMNSIYEMPDAGEFHPMMNDNNNMQNINGGKSDAFHEMIFPGFPHDNKYLMEQARQMDGGPMGFIGAQLGSYNQGMRGNGQGTLKWAKSHETRKPSEFMGD